MGSAGAKRTLGAFAIELFAEVCFMKARFYAGIFTSQLLRMRMLEKMFDSLRTQRNMRAPGTDTGFQQEPDMHAPQNLASNMNNAR